MDAKAVHEVIATMERETRSVAARKAMARAALSHSRNLTEGGRHAWQEYLGK